MILPIGIVPALNALCPKMEIVLWPEIKTRIVMGASVRRKRSLVCYIVKISQAAPRRYETITHDL